MGTNERVIGTYKDERIQMQLVEIGSSKKQLHYQFGDREFVIPNGEFYTYYSMRNTEPFENRRELSKYLSSIAKHAAHIGFHVEDFSIDKEDDPNTIFVVRMNSHYGLLPETHYQFKGSLQLLGKDKEKVEYVKGKKETYQDNDQWSIWVDNSGEIVADLNPVETLPLLPWSRKPFAKREAKIHRATLDQILAVERAK